MQQQKQKQQMQRSRLGNTRCVASPSGRAYNVRHIVKRDPATYVHVRTIRKDKVRAADEANKQNYRCHGLKSGERHLEQSRYCWGKRMLRVCAGSASSSCIVKEDQA
jgi:hypothetical protein